MKPKYKEIEKPSDRYIEVFSEVTSKWEKIKFSSLRNGDIFRIFDGETRYVNEETGDNIWIAVGEPYVKNNIWTIKTLF